LPPPPSYETNIHRAYLQQNERLYIITSTMVRLSGSYRYAAELNVSPRPPTGLQEAPIDTPRDIPLPSKKHEYNRGYSKGYTPENRDTAESAVDQILNTRRIMMFLFHRLISHLIVKSYYIIKLFRR